MPQAHGGHFRYHVIWSALIGFIVAIGGGSLEALFTEFFEKIGVHDFFVQIWPTGWSPRWIPAALGVSIFVGGLFWGNRRNSQPSGDRALPETHQNVKVNPQQTVTVTVGSPWTQAVAPAASTEEKPRPINRDIDVERAICEKVEAEIPSLIREARNRTGSQEYIDALNNNINRDLYQRFDVFWKSLNLRVQYYLPPLLERIVQNEANLRSTHKRPFTEDRIKRLREILQNLVIDDWSVLVAAAYSDSIDHVIKKQGSLRSYVERELEKTRLDAEKETDSIFSYIDEILKKASADSKLAASV
jgi:hypothetical protein